VVVGGDDTGLRRHVDDLSPALGDHPRRHRLCEQDGARRFTAIVSSHASTLSTGAIRAMPAQFTRTSMVPCSASAAAAALRGPFTVAMSARS
jgi:hypothetical protein